MAIAGSRFDPEMMRREAEEAKARAKQKKVQALIVNGCVLLGVGVAALIGWNYWKNYSDEKEREAMEQQAREEKSRVDAAKAEAARKAAEVAKREAERIRQQKIREEREAERQRQIKEREELRLKQEKERLRIQQERQETRAREEKARIETAQRKGFIEKSLSSLPLDAKDHIVIRSGLESRLTLEVDDKLWMSLKEAQKDRALLDFFELARGTTVTNDFNTQCYPDRETFERMLKYINSRKFQLIVRPSESIADIQGLALVGTDTKKGLTVPKGVREMTNSAGRRTGWTVPFALGDEPNIFIMESTAVTQFTRDWRKISSRLNPEEVESELKNFAQSVRTELSHPAPVEKVEKKETPRQTKSRPTLSGGSDIRSFGRNKK